MHVDYVNARHGVGAMQPSPRASSEGVARVGSHGHWSQEEPRGRRMSPGLQKIQGWLVAKTGLMAKTGLFATLCARLRAKGTGAPTCLPAPFRVSLPACLSLPSGGALGAPKGYQGASFLRKLLPPRRPAQVVFPTLLACPLVASLALAATLAFALVASFDYPLLAARRAHLLERLNLRVHSDGSVAEGALNTPGLSAEAMLGVACTVIETHLLRKDHRPLVALTGTLAGLIVMPYLGPPMALAQMEKRRTTLTR